MAESIVSFLVGRIGTFIEEEINLQKGVRYQIVLVKDELEQIGVFIRVAEEMEERDAQLSMWIKQVRNVAFDMEDVLDEFRLRLTPSPNHESRNFISILTRSRCIKNIKSRHHIASKIQSIKLRVVSIADARQRYNFPIPSSINVRESSWEDRRADAVLLEEADLVGVDQPKKQLTQWLTRDDPATKVLSVVGMGGLGKTALVKKVYDEVQVKKHFNPRVWISVSQSFNLEELLKKVIVQLCDESKQSTPQRMETMAAHDLKGVIKNFIQATRFLIVLDDVWTTEAWDQFKYALPKFDHGSRVMLTTRNVDVAATSCTEYNGEMYALKPLPKEYSWRLFCRRTFQSDDCPSHLENVCKHIEERCKGLPLAVVTIGGLLATKDKTKTDEWNLVNRDLGGELEKAKLLPMTRILLLSYYSLPFYLKACLLYTCLFPEDYSIELSRLIRLWISEGFIVEKKGRTSEEVGENYLNELLNRSLIQVVDRYECGRIRRYRVHDIMREVLVSKAIDQSFAMIFNNENRKWPEKARRLSVHYGFPGNANEMMGDFKFRSLLLFGVKALPENTPILEVLGRKKSRFLKVLDMSGTSMLRSFPREVLKLSGLRYLNLRDTQIGDLPPSIGDELPSLETLDLKGSNVTKLPATVVKLRRLRHLVVYRYEIDGRIRRLHVVECVSGIERLQFLQKLCWIDVSQGCEVIESIGMLQQLRKLRICHLKPEHGKVLCSSINQLTNLQSLSIASTDDREIIDLEGISAPPTFLQRLFLRGSLEKIPDWMSSLENLTTLALMSTGLGGNAFESIQMLPNLTVLRINKAFKEEKLYFKAGGFQMLKSLIILDLPALRRVEIEKGSMPSLESLDIEKCKLLQRVPSGIEHLANPTSSIFLFQRRRKRVFETNVDICAPINLKEMYMEMDVYLFFISCAPINLKGIRDNVHRYKIK
ncbi:hypothetical protein K2173_010017 [Erythroxylum novogranatense]|uniref:Disease resistance protein RPM1-like n=1 Tax=Erythroxylum novogranatense TaxID=1862640 RepID=A0AAV8SQM5_9ROSI|nr:hypothetical protein K2173_010017 [Erythroxylum novogranatense]